MYQYTGNLKTVYNIITSVFLLKRCCAFHYCVHCSHRERLLVSRRTLRLTKTTDLPSYLLLYLLTHFEGTQKWENKLHR